MCLVIFAGTRKFTSFARAGVFNLNKSKKIETESPHSIITSISGTNRIDFGAFLPDTN